MTRFDFDGSPNRIVGDGLMILVLAVVAGALLWTMIGCTHRRPGPLCPSDSAAGRRTCRQMHPADIRDDWIDRDCDPREGR